MQQQGFARINVASVLAESAKRYPEHTAVTLGPQSLNYTQLWAQTRAYAGALSARGVGQGTKVALLMPNIPHFAFVYYGALALGATVVPVHALLKRHEIAYVLEDSGASLLIAAAPLLGEGAPGAQAAGVDLLSVLAPEELGTTRLEDLAAAATPIDHLELQDPGAIAAILYTSGTTGKPKGAMLSHFALLEQTSALLVDTFDMTDTDKIFGALPLFHIFGQTVVLNLGIRAGAELVLVPKFNGPEAWDALLDQGITIMAGVPTMYVGLVEAARGREGTPPALRYAVSGGASLPVAVLERFEQATGARIHEGYGLTETSPVVSFNEVGTDPRPGTIGRPIWGIDAEIADPAVPDRIVLLPRGELGEVVVRGHNLFSGYLGRPEATAEAVVEGWFRTGDLGTKDEEDYLRIMDRKKDMVIRNGYNVYPREVEEALLTHPEIANAAVYGISDPVHGQEIAASVTLTPASTLTADAILAYGQERLAAYKYPRIVKIVTEFPMGPSGKILKRELVRVAEDGPDAAPEAG
ncbi:MAG: long-chain fatty acid--CoA ligase [Arthrobacter sp.]|jgi:long-chain acyl-CoA synthetase|nr:long-chain fatty acid--CoA ligase [Arthrobacter sp.]